MNHSESHPASIAAIKSLGALLSAYPAEVGLQSSMSLRWYALIDLAAYASKADAQSNVSAYVVDAGSAVNLYGDMDGLELMSQGPQLVELVGDPAVLDQIAPSPEILRGVSLIGVDSQIDGLALHLRALREVTLPNGSKALFRYQDPRVMSALMPLLDSKQRSAMLGPASCWVCCDPCGALTAIKRVGGAAREVAFRLSSPLLAAVDEALLPYELIAQAREADSAALGTLTPCQRLELARRHIADARASGLASPEDVSLYGVLAFQLPQGFATAAPFDTAIAQTAGGRTSFSQALDNADPGDWALWNEQLSREDGM